ncbi:MAG TPA: hypothetical protein VNW15_04845 [Rhizomicrobium sp.]|jgi:hypothetical protein|nr:hypothetical protein [Rhizomicrobium sp.]
MACVVKQPVNGTKGFLVITDGELHDLLETSTTLQDSVRSLRTNWVVAVHCNSSVQQNVRANELIDAYIAGPGDIIPLASFTPYQLTMDCSNFCPDYFQRQPGRDQKFWDVLFVSRNQEFKSLDVLFQTVREIFDAAPMRVLAIITHGSAADTQLDKSEPLRLYMSMFTVAERKLFTLLTPWVDYPFPFDLQTLALFYHQSRSFLHTARDERHPRVVAYAWAAGIPVIGPPSVAALLPDDLRQPPGFFSFKDANQAAAAVRRAVEASTSLPPVYSEFHLASFQIPRLKQEIQKLYAHLGIGYVDAGWFLDNLDLRLARHHVGNAGTNAARASLLQLTKQLIQPFPSDIAGDAELALDAYTICQSDDARVEKEAVVGRLLFPMRRFGEIRRERGMRRALQSMLRVALLRMFGEAG